MPHFRENPQVFSAQLFEKELRDHDPVESPITGIYNAETNAETILSE